ncbi:MAG: hypothetical protein J6I30_19750, partial [Pseudomonas sp.]|nr:hypothetical protein [Pseudomonas sp.]
GFFVHKKRSVRVKIEAEYYALVTLNCTDHPAYRWVQTIYPRLDEHSSEAGVFQICLKNDQLRLDVRQS